jgi:hypothetical protein
MSHKSRFFVTKMTGLRIELSVINVHSRSGSRKFLFISASIVASSGARSQINRCVIGLFPSVMCPVYSLLRFRVYAHHTPHHVKISLLGFLLFPYLKMMKVGVRNPIICDGIETRLRAGRFRVYIPAGEQGVLQNVCTISTAHPASYSVGTKVTAVVKRPGREVNHSSPCSAKVKNEWSYTSIPFHCPHGVDRERFTFTYYHRCTALQAGKSRVRLPLVSFEFFIHIFLAAALWPWSRLNL